jgi:hypothetical protein
VDFPALRARAHISAPDGAVDYGPDGPVDYARWCVLWITRAVLAVDYDASHLWISQPCGLGRIYLGFTLWISGVGRGGGWLRPHTPQAGLGPARFASCGCSSGAHGRRCQGGA